MGKNYGKKCATRRGRSPNVGNDVADDAQMTLLEFAQEHAAYSSFGKFILAGKTSKSDQVTFYFGDTLFVYDLDEQQGSRIGVMKTENPLLYEGAFIYTRELERLAATGKSYFLKSNIRPNVETARKEIIDQLLLAIGADGGHHEVMKIINAGLEKIQHEENKKQMTIRAERIFGDIASGNLKSDPLLVFKGEGVLGFGFDSLPKVFLVEYQHTRDGNRLFVTLDAAPLGTGGDFSVGTSMQVSHIFHLERFYSDEESDVKSMARYFIRLFGKSACLDEAKDRARKLAVQEGWLGQVELTKPKNGISFRADISTDGLVTRYAGHDVSAFSSGMQTVH